MFALSTQENNLYLLQTKRRSRRSISRQHRKRETNTEPVTVRQYSCDRSFLHASANGWGWQREREKEPNEKIQPERWMKRIIKWAKVCANNAPNAKTQSEQNEFDEIQTKTTGYDVYRHIHFLSCSLLVCLATHNGCAPHCHSRRRSESEHEISNKKKL